MAAAVTLTLKRSSLVAQVADAIRTHRPLARLALPIAAWLHFIRTQATAATPIVDPLHEQLATRGRSATGDSQHDLPLFLNLPGVFPASVACNTAFVQALGRAYDAIARRGPLAAVAHPDAG